MKSGRPQKRISVREFSVRLFFENQAWRDATPFFLFVSVEVGDFYGSDEVVSNCLSGQKASIQAYEPNAIWCSRLHLY